ncbi:MAG: Gfo/Idh/MocA family oxidoreductase [Clostridia bacterium]|nr:Gfo/Idh/MocA family oxidoreductase [Clostridia bacterium]
MSSNPVTAIIVGGGHRAFTYAELALQSPEKLKIVGIADPNPFRCEKARKTFGFPKENCFSSAEELAAVPKFADAIINGTMDHQHFETAVPLLKCGYDMLLEKPFVVNMQELDELVDIVKEHGNRVMICHVLRYTPFYLAIKERILAGEIGDIISINMSEHVSYHHASTSYVRGKWGNSDICKTPMLLAKCCHDMDIMMWLMGDIKPKTVSSCGSIFQYKPEMAPEGAGTKCLVDCPHVNTCLYSAKRIYIDNPDRWEFYVWSALEDMENATIEDKINLLKGDSPYGKCIYKSGNNVVDHQSVMVNFENGATGTHNMIGGASRPLRRIEIVGTKGEIFGEFEHNDIHVLKINPDPGKEFDEEIIDLSAFCEGGGHGGGDLGLAEDFVNFIRGEKPSVSCTTIFDSVTGHKSIFLAEESRLNGSKAVEY